MSHWFNNHDVTEQLNTSVWYQYTVITFYHCCCQTCFLVWFGFFMQFLDVSQSQHLPSARFRNKKTQKLNMTVMTTLFQGIRDERKRHFTWNSSSLPVTYSLHSENIHQTSLSPVVLFIVTRHDLPLLALARRSVHLLGDLHQADLLELILREEPAATDRRCLRLPLLHRNTLKLLRLKQPQETLTLKQSSCV